MTVGVARSALLGALERQRFDLIVIGAGINGSGIARDGAMRGLRVLLLDKGDIGGGTTSFSTRLIHGGLRYLEYAEFGLVRESLRERERLLHIAPHLVTPHRFLIPLYTGARRGSRLIRLGMLAYDLLSFDKSLPRHTMLTPEQTLALEPGLNREGLRGAAVYSDAQVAFPERLSVENACSARQYGATVLTYARVDGLIRAGNTVQGVRFTDVLGDRIYTAYGTVTLNVAGPWVDQVLGDASLPPLIGGTKGTHIVVDTFPGAPSSALYIEASRDRRPYFVVPWNGRYLIGTTDTRFVGDLDQVEPDAQEIDYLIDETNRAIPGARLTRDAVQYAYAGVRPLPYNDGTSAASVTRRHIIHDHAPQIEGLISIVGGKITTYRSLAQSTIDLGFRKLHRTAPRCTTAAIALPGATRVDWPAFAATFRNTSTLEPRCAERLLRLYGIMAWEIVGIARAVPELGEVFDAQSGAIGAEVVYAMRHEMAQTLADILLRRTMLGLGSDAGLNSVEPVARIAMKYAGWDRAYASQNIEDYRRSITKRTLVLP